MNPHNALVCQEKMQVWLLDIQDRILKSHFPTSIPPFFFDIILRLDKNYIHFSPSVSTGSSVSSFSAFTSLPSFHFLIVRLQVLLFCLSSVVGVLQLCTVSKAFNFIPQLPFSSDAPLYSHTHTQSCCCFLL